MSPLRPGHILFFVLCAAVIFAEVRYNTPRGLTPMELHRLSWPPSTPPTFPAPAATVYRSIAPAESGSFPAPGEVALQGSAPEKGDPVPSPRGIEEILARTVKEKFPEAGLSEGQIAEIVQAIQAVRESLEGLQTLERTPENAAAIASLAGRVDQGIRRIEAATGMSASAFLNRISTEGIDNDKPEKDSVVLEVLDSPGR